MEFRIFPSMLNAIRSYPRTLRGRLNLLISGLLCLFGMAIAAMAVDDARRSVREELEAASKVGQQLLRFSIEREIDRGARVDPERLVEMARRLGRIRAQEIVISDATGAVRYRSPPPSYKAGRNAPRWFSTLITPHTEALHMPLGALEIEMIPDPSRAVLDAWDDLCVLAIVLVIFLVTANYLVHRLARRSICELEQVVNGMKRMASGQLEVRLPAMSVPELERLRQSFNAMACALEESRDENARLAHDQQVAQLVQSRLEEERRAIARELHDELGQCVTAVRAIALSIARRSENDRPDIHGSAHGIAAAAGSMYDAVHDIVARLRPAPLVRLGLAEGLREWLRGWQANYPCCQVELCVKGAPTSVSPAIELAVFRIVQEALSNAVRHGEARGVQVSLTFMASGLLVCVDDDGVGLGKQPGNDGRMGLQGMRERAAELGGTLAVCSLPTRGARVLAEFPMGQTAG